MKNKGFILGLALTGTVLLSGCSFGSLLDHAVGEPTQTSSVETSSSSSYTDVDILTGKTVDESVNAPSFSKQPSGMLALVKGNGIKLEADAQVNDGGTVSYQWYMNNINSNGGGTPIQGATSNVLAVDTSEAKTTYYYVVAINTRGDKINMSVSTTKGIAVWEAGSWKQDEKGMKYVEQDESFPADTQFIEGGKLFTINAEGYATDGGAPAPDVVS